METRQPAPKRPLRIVPQLPLMSGLALARWLLLITLGVAFWFFHGFIVPVLAATVIAVASWGWLLRLRNWLGLDRIGGAVVMILLIIVFIVIPISISMTAAAHELHSWINWTIEVNRDGAPVPGWIAAIPQVGDTLALKWDEEIGRPGAIGELVQVVTGSNIGVIYRSLISAGTFAFHMFLTLVFMLIALFVFYRDGDMIAHQIDRAGRYILPDRWTRLSRVVPATISSTVTGMTVIAFAEGVILGTAYWMAGVPSPVTFGVITGFMALVPGGAPLCFTLASLYLGFSGSPWAGLALFTWGSLELFIVDKTVRPVLVGGPVKMPFLPTFFGLVGGVKTMGLLGIFIGPVIMAILVAIWREWQAVIPDEPLAEEPEYQGPPQPIGPQTEPSPPSGSGNPA